MPEPFAVFQYYRHGLRHPLVSEQRKHVALVLDFGGGTFDVSVVESTKAGDISGGGVNSRPLGAKSAQVGGFYINRLMAEELLFSVVDACIEKPKLRKALTFFYEHRNAEEEFVAKLNDSERHLFLNMKELLQAVEQAKLSICRSIANWSLSADLSGVAPFSVSVPTNPYAKGGRRAAARLDAKKIQKVYVERIWPERLRDTIISTIERAKDDLGGQVISVVLLAGGSSNIRWLGPLLERDLRKHLEHAQVLELNENFQEIVAKGLATECARRHYTGGQGDFRAVTYNRLCLLLRPDDGEMENKQFRPMASIMSHGTADLDTNVLLPTASSLRGLLDKKLQWRVRLNKLPKRVLSYYFMRSSFDPDDLDARHNVVDTKVFTPPGTQFQQNMVVELIVRADGTAEPYFVYGQNNVREGTVAPGRPFYIDSTFAAEEVQGETYLGFDFGTSTSSCSYVSSTDIQLIEHRARSTDWLDLGELVGELPYPAAAPLARYMSEMDPHRRNERGREAVEAMLTLAAYVALAELSAQDKPSTALFKGMAHRSAGPLWGLLKQSVQLARSDQSLLGILTPLIKDHATQIDNWVNEIASSKHGRSTAVDYVTLLAHLGNYLAKMMDGWTFGVFENVTAKRFIAGQFQGILRDLRGPSQTFINVLEYEGPVSFGSGDVYIAHVANGVALDLSPLYLWGLNTIGGQNVEADLFEFDTVRKGEFGFRSVQSGSVVNLDENGVFREVWQHLKSMREREQSKQKSTGLSLLAWNRAY